MNDEKISISNISLIFVSKNEPLSYLSKMKFSILEDNIKLEDLKELIKYLIKNLENEDFSFDKVIDSIFSIKDEKVYLGIFYFNNKSLKSNFSLDNLSKIINIFKHYKYNNIFLDTLKIDEIEKLKTLFLQKEK